MRPAPFALIVLLCACADPDLPDLRQAVSAEARRAPYPTLLPADALIARSQAGSHVVVQTADFESRVARLKQRAALLRNRPILDAASRLRLLRASQTALAR